MGLRQEMRVAAFSFPLSFLASRLFLPLHPSAAGRSADATPVSAGALLMDASPTTDNAPDTSILDTTWPSALPRNLSFLLGIALSIA
jgi:hypothetical protein